MTSLALQASPFSVITTGPRSRTPAWKALLDWPRFGDAHIDYAVGNPAQRNLWAARLDEAVLHADKPVLLIASAESCLATAWWARLSPTGYVSKVAGALLFAPRGGKAELFASPRTPLPFPSAIVERNPARRTMALAESWGSAQLDGWQADAESAWQQAQAAVLRLTARVVEREMRVTKAFDVIV